MGKFKRDYGEVERREFEGYDGEAPTPGIYDAKLVSSKEHTSSAGNEGTEWIFEITGKDGDESPFTGWRGYVYTNDNSAAWKEVQILEAVKILAPGKDSVSTTHEKIVEKAKPCRIKVSNETYEGERKGKIKTILPAKEASTKAKSRKAADDDDDDDDDDEDPF